MEMILNGRSNSALDERLDLPTRQPATVSRSLVLPVEAHLHSAGRLPALLAALCADSILQVLAGRCRRHQSISRIVVVRASQC
jgi:hypothetical protein